MRYLKVVFVFVSILLLFTILNLKEPGSVAVAFGITPSPTPTNTPPTPPTTPPPTTPPPEPTTITPTPSNTRTGEPPETPTATPHDETPVPTPSVIPALGTGPRLDSIIFYGALLLVLFVVVAGGWVKVWQAHRRQNL